jgi:SLOG in TRPM, prokaryote
VTLPFRIELTGAASALGVHVSEATELPAAVEMLGLHPPRPTVVVVGGAAGLEEARIDGLRPVFATGIAPVMQMYGAVGVDGGTRFGVMRLFGEARAAKRAAFPLVGVVAAGPVKLPRGQALAHVETVLEAHHTHFVVVPGDKWGAEAPWIARTATVLAGATPSITVLVNGGQIAYSDVQQSVEAGRPVVVIAGSGGTADVFAGALAGAPADHRAAALISSGLFRVIPKDQPTLLAELLTATLGESAAT